MQVSQVIFREPYAQVTHLKHGTETRWLTKPPELPRVAVTGRRIHIHSRSGQYLVIKTTPYGFWITTNSWIRDGYYKVIPLSDFKCFTGGYPVVHNVSDLVKKLKNFTNLI